MMCAQNSPPRSFCRQSFETMRRIATGGVQRSSAISVKRAWSCCDATQWCGVSGHWGAMGRRNRTMPSEQDMPNKQSFGLSQALSHALYSLTTGVNVEGQFSKRASVRSQSRWVVDSTWAVAFWRQLVASAEVLNPVESALSTDASKCTSICGNAITMPSLLNAFQMASRISEL